MRLVQELPQKIKLRSRHVKKNRDLFFLSYFSMHCHRIKTKIDNLIFMQVTPNGEKVLYQKLSSNITFERRRRKRSYFDDNMMETELIGKKRNNPSDEKEPVELSVKMTNQQKKLVKVALAFVSGIGSIRVSGQEIICLVEDFNLEKEEVTLIVPKCHKNMLEQYLEAISK